MKRIITMFFSVFIVFILISSSAEIVYAEEIEEGISQTDEITQQIDDMLADYDINFSMDDVDELSVESLSEAMKESVISRMTAPFKLLGILILITVFSAFIQNINNSALSSDGSSSIFRLVYIVSAVTIISEPLMTSFENASESMKNGGEFMLLFIPVFAAVSAFSGLVESVESGDSVKSALLELCRYIVISGAN